MNKIMSPFFIKKFFYKILFILVGIVLGVGLTFLYIQKYGIPFKQVLVDASNIEETKQIKEIVEKVGKLIFLPENEDPAMATITDAGSLMKEQPFYVGSQNGDVVLIYEKALKAIIYSPERNIIVNVGPVSTTPPEVKREQVLPTEENVSPDEN